MNEELLSKCNRVQRITLILGVVLFVIAGLDGIRAPEQFFRSYLLAFIFWIGFPLGCAALLMIHYLTGGDWGLPIKQPLEAAVRSFPLMAGLVIPLLFGIGFIFIWSHPDRVAADPILQAKHVYLNMPFFIGRQVLYFCVWLWVCRRLIRLSGEMTRTGDPIFEDKLEAMSGPGLVLYGLTITFFSIDWVMSLDPHWFSTIFGMIFMVIQVQAAIAFSILVSRVIGAYEPVSNTMSPLRFNDLGNLLLTFVMLWAYLGFSQFLIIWAGDLLNEITWYSSRIFHGWAVVALILIVFYFAVPFTLLLMRATKRRITILSAVGVLVLFLNLIDVYWMIVPAFHPNGPRFYLLDFLLLAGMGSLWLAVYISRLKAHPLLPERDPRFEGVLESGT